MGCEAMCFIERSAAARYCTKEGGRRVGGHNTSGNIYNVENKGIYNVSGKDGTDKTNSRCFQLLKRVEAALSKHFNTASRTSNIGTAFNWRSTAGPLECSWEICDIVAMI